MGRRRTCVLIATVAALSFCPSAFAAVRFTRLTTDSGGGDPQTGIVRTPDGTLHLIYSTSPQRGGVDGLAALTISAGGKVGPVVQALSGWQTGFPGMVGSGSG